MHNRINDHINEKIMENELATDDWEFNALAWELHWWIDFFNLAFFKDEPVPIPALTFEKARVNNLGFYRLGLNDWAVRNQININKLYINHPLWETLSTLLHEMTHSYEYIYIPKEGRTKNWYHKKAFRIKLAAFGILTNEKGCHIAIGDPFIHLLRQHGVTFDKSIQPGTTTEIPPKSKKKGTSKLKKWTCGCTNVRVAVADFQANCLKCGNHFELQ
jgi:hypothetical protein